MASKVCLICDCNEFDLKNLRHVNFASKIRFVFEKVEFHCRPVDGWLRFARSNLQYRDTKILLVVQSWSWDPVSVAEHEWPIDQLEFRVDLHPTILIFSIFSTNSKPMFPKSTPKDIDRWSNRVDIFWRRISSLDEKQDRNLQVFLSKSFRDTKSTVIRSDVVYLINLEYRDPVGAQLEKNLDEELRNFVVFSCSMKKFLCQPPILILCDEKINLFLFWWIVNSIAEFELIIMQHHWSFN